ncbi:MAG: cell division protein FtsW, partial [Candidatus Berkelbacteria bacterium Licking1014_85]
MSLSDFRNKVNARGDYWLFVFGIVLALIGLMMILSSSVVISFERFNTNYYYVIRQSIYFAVAIVFFLITSNINYRYWQTKAVALLIISLVFLLAVFIPGIGLHLSGAQRWISLGPILIQPSEIIKLTFVLYLAAWLESRRGYLHHLSEGLLPFAILLLIIVFLIIKQPDMGTVMIITLVAGVMFYLAEAPMAYIFGGL